MDRTSQPFLFFLVVGRGERNPLWYLDLVVQGEVEMDGPDGLGLS